MVRKIFTVTLSLINFFRINKSIYGSFAENHRELRILKIHVYHSEQQKLLQFSKFKLIIKSNNKDMYRTRVRVTNNKVS